MLVILFSHFSTRYMLKGNGVYVYTKVYLVKIVWQIILGAQE